MFFPVWGIDVVASGRETGHCKLACADDAAAGVSSSAAAADYVRNQGIDRYTLKDRAIVFFGIALVWIVYDRLTKVYFEGSYSLGQVSPIDYLVIRFRLVHNTGMAWGLFGDSTFMLGAFSLIVCAAIVALFFFYDKLFLRPPTLVESTALGLILAGGIGNAIDRFIQGYVIDFLEFTFIDFPVFNIADIGVTCGFALLLICLFLPHKVCNGDADANCGSANGAVSSAGEGDGRE